MRKNKTNKTSKKNNRKSLKGTWGHIGAPPKPMKWPTVPFVMATLFKRNKGLCELTVRKNVDKALINGETPNPAGTVYELEPLAQRGGSVGRPKSRFVLKANYDASKMTLRNRTVKTAKAPKAPKATPAVTVTAPEPTVAVTNLAGPVVETVVATPAPAAPAPETPVVEAPATPAVIETPAVTEAPSVVAVPVTELVNS